MGALVRPPQGFQQPIGPSDCKAPGKCIEFGCGLVGCRAPGGDEKPTNPKDAISSSKLPLHLVSPVVKAYQAVVHLLGNVKYGAWNYRAGGARASVYRAALERHMDRWWEGEELDPVDGTPHLANALACIDILIDCSVMGNLQDDRPPSAPIARVYEDMERITAAVLEKYGDRRPRHYTIADTAKK